jgi:hypothetical protein
LFLIMSPPPCEIVAGLLLKESKTVGPPKRSEDGEVKTQLPEEV